MLTTSQNYSPDQRGEFHGTLTPLGSSAVTVSDGDIVLESVTLTENCCDRKFGFGSFISAQLDMTLKLGGEHDLQAPLLTRAQLDLSRKFFDGSSQTAVLPLGHFFVDDSSVRRTKTSAAFTAYDASSYFDRSVSADPADVADLTPYEIIEYACECVSACLLLIFGSGYSVTMAQTAAQISGYPNASRQFSWLHTSEEMLTYRDMVCAALGVMGAWGRINRLGQFEIHRFDVSAATYTIDGANAVKRSISDSAARITGVSCGDINFGTDAQTYDITTNPLMNSVTGSAIGSVVQALGNSGYVRDFDIYTADISWFGDLVVEAGDCIGYSDGGTTTKIIAMETIWKPHGLGTIRAYGVNSESGKTKTGDNSSGDVPYIKSNIVTPQVEELTEYVTDDLLGGNTISPKITKTQYNAMPSHDPKKLYIVRDENAGKTELYLGDEHIDTGSGGGRIEYAAIVSGGGWTPATEPIDVFYSQGVPAYYGGAPARMIIQGYKMLFNVPFSDITVADVYSDITLKDFYNNGLDDIRAWVYVRSQTATTVEIGFKATINGVAYSSANAYYARYAITPSQMAGFTCGICLDFTTLSARAAGSTNPYLALADGVVSRDGRTDHIIFLVAFLGGNILTPVSESWGTWRGFQQVTIPILTTAESEYHFDFGTSKRFEPEVT